MSAGRDSLQADAMARRYYDEGGEWLWAETPEMTEQGHEVLSYLKEHVRETGFNPAAFFIPQISEDLERLDSLRLDSLNTMPEVMARTEWNLTRAYLRYARGQRYGFMNPTFVLNRTDLRDEQPGNFKQVFDIRIEQPDSAFATRAASEAAAGRAVAFLRDMEPADSIYRRLAHLLPTDTATYGTIRLLCNMERRRWRADRKPAADGRYILVNIPALQLWAVAPDSVFAMRICCGAWKTKTPLLHSAISYIEVNPEWVIPGSIVKNEVSHHAGDSAYFARNRYFAVNRTTGDTVSARHLSQQQLQSGTFKVVQRSGHGNSLGRLIFRFPNQFAVYLHDTNNRGTFSADKRTVSHGCVRVERPFDLVEFLLPDADEWYLDKIRLSIDMPPVSEKGQDFMDERNEEENNSPIRLLRTAQVNPRVPVFLTYYTLYPNPATGRLEIWPDRYEYDKHIIRALRPYLLNIL